ncbi:sporulation protein, partial [Nonomuraea angiospora]|nr:sporulation protein [Nonomuraea angiospora]
GEGGGSGGGFGFSATPAGVYVLKDGEVSWRPAVDVNRIVLGGQIVLIVAALTVRSILKKRRRRR